MLKARSTVRRFKLMHYSARSVGTVGSGSDPWNAAVPINEHQSVLPSDGSGRSHSARESSIRRACPGFLRQMGFTRSTPVGGTADKAEDKAEGQKTEFVRRHAVRIPRLVLLRVRGTIAW